MTSDAPSAPRRRAGARTTVTLASLAMIGPFTIDTIFPAFPRMAQDLQASDVALQQVVAAYLASFAVMSIFHGPLSDALGRKRVMLGGLAVYVLAMLGSALAPSLPVLIALRVVQGGSAGAATIVSRVVIRDMFAGPEAQRLMANVMMIFSLAPAIAPVVGGWLLALGSWRIVFVAIALYAVGTMIAAARLPETLPPQARTPLRVGAILGSLLHVARSGALWRLAFAMAFGFASQFVYVAAAAIVVPSLLHLGEQAFAVLFVPLIAGMMSGSWLVGRVAEAIPRPRLISIGLGATVLAATVNALLVALGPTPPGGLHPSLLLAVVGPMLLGFTVALFFSPIQLEVLDMFPHERGSAASASTFASLAFNAVLAGVIVPLVTGSLVDLALCALGLSVLGLGLWAWHLAQRSRPAGSTPA